MTRTIVSDFAITEFYASWLCLFSSHPPDDTVPPHDDAGHKQQGRHEAHDRPQRLQRPVAPSAEVQPCEPREKNVSGSLAEVRPEAEHELVRRHERVGDAQVDA